MSYLFYFMFMREKWRKKSGKINEKKKKDETKA